MNEPQPITTVSILATYLVIGAANPINFTSAVRVY